MLLDIYECFQRKLQYIKIYFLLPVNNDKMYIMFIYHKNLCFVQVITRQNRKNYQRLIRVNYVAVYELRHKFYTTMEKENTQNNEGREYRLFSNLKLKQTKFGFQNLKLLYEIFKIAQSYLIIIILKQFKESKNLAFIIKVVFQKSLTL